MVFVSCGLALTLAGVFYKDGELLGMRLISDGDYSSAGYGGVRSQRGVGIPSRLTSPDEPASICTSAGCVRTAAEILDNLDTSVDPCQDFFKFSCGGFVQRTAIPDDRTRMSSFSVLGDKLLTQVRMLLEEPPKEGEAKPITMARAVYQSCMDTEGIERLGLEPVKDILRQLGGWPVLEGPQWDARWGPGIATRPLWKYIFNQPLSDRICLKGKKHLLGRTVRGFLSNFASNESRSI